jgi:hypothetical protein
VAILIVRVLKYFFGLEEARFEEARVESSFFLDYIIISITTVKA